ncbi:MAG TPA: hypothetical protein VII56_00980 [Rhizomicrobium sp.]
MATIHEPSRHREPLTWHETISRASYYSFGIAALWAIAFVLFQLFGPHHP